MHGTDNHPNPSPETESLVKRLAGPSTTKAGYALQSEINRIIAEASKGSKFYEVSFKPLCLQLSVTWPTSERKEEG